LFIPYILLNVNHERTLLDHCMLVVLFLGSKSRYLVYVPSVIFM